MLKNKRQKILLYNPEAVFFTMPLGLLAIGSALNADKFEVKIIDGRLQENVEQALAAEIDDALCLGVTVLTGRPIADALRISRFAKQRRPDLPVIWGGWHPSLFAVECLDEDSVDLAVYGQGEATFAQVVEALSQGQSLREIQGIAHKAAVGSAKNPPRPLAKMNDLPRHNYDLIPVQRYFELKKQRQLDYISSTGCNFRCTFCADPFVYERKWTAIEPARVGEEIGHLWRKYRFEDLAFQDETFFTRDKRVVEIAEEFLDRSLQFTWTGTLRADQGCRLDNEAFALCKKSGLRRVMIGVESGSQKTLNWLKKDITIEQVFASAEQCVRHGIAAIFPFIVGFPDEPEESVLETMKVIKQLRAMSPDFETVIFFYRPYPGSPLADLVKDKGLPMPETLEAWADFDYVDSYGSWVAKEKWQRIQRFKFYSRFACGRNGTPWRWAFQRLANWRCQHDFYGFPVEKTMLEFFRPPERLS